MSRHEGKGGPQKLLKVNITRRALIETGWVLPAVVVVAVPSKAFAEYGQGAPDPESKGNGGNHGSGGGQNDHDGSSFHSEP